MIVFQLSSWAMTHCGTALTIPGQLNSAHQRPCTGSSQFNKRLRPIAWSRRNSPCNCSRIRPRARRLLLLRRGNAHDAQRLLMREPDIRSTAGRSPARRACR